MGSFLNFNGKLILQSEFQLPFPNRAFRYGDGFFEAIRVYAGKIPLLDYHLLRIKYSAAIIQLTDLPNDDELVNQLENLIQQNNEPNARLRLTFFRSDEGLYTPINNNALYLAETSPMATLPFELNKNGLIAGFYPERVKLTDSKLSNIKTLSSANYVLAGLHIKNNGWDDGIILNSDERPCEFYSANLFIVKNGKLYTPPLSEGCVNGAFRLLLKDILKDELIEKPLTKTDVLQADEVFLTSGIRGIQWIKKIEGITYKCNQTTELHHQVMKSIGL